MPLFSERGKISIYIVEIVILKLLYKAVLTLYLCYTIGLTEECTHAMKHDYV